MSVLRGVRCTITGADLLVRLRELSYEIPDKGIYSWLIGSYAFEKIHKELKSFPRSFISIPPNQLGTVPTLMGFRFKSISAIDENSVYLVNESLEIVASYTIPLMT